MLRSDPTQRPRLVEIRDNLIARVGEAELEGWLGEVEGLRINRAGTEEELNQLDAKERRISTVVNLGMPTFGRSPHGQVKPRPHDSAFRPQPIAIMRQYGSAYRGPGSSALPSSPVQP